MTLAPAQSTFDRAALLAALEAAWARSDRIFDLLKSEALLMRPIALRQPLIFYVGHLPAFGWNQVCRGLLAMSSAQPAFDDLFARGIDPVGVDAYEGSEAWPSLGEVLAYRDRVRGALRDSFDEVEALSGTDVLADHGRVYQLVIEHELMHHETLLYMLQQLDRRFLVRPADLPACRLGAGAAPGRVRVPKGEAIVGASFDSVPFGWDNEFEAQRSVVDSFEIDQTPVRNAQWLEFMEAGGYGRQDLWEPEAWAWRQRVGHEHPVFWKRSGAAWSYQTLFDELPLRDVADWPVYVSWAEADAYARWRDAQLPTEAEFHRAAEGISWGEAARGNLDFANWAPTPVGSYPEGASRWGVLDLLGNGWEWTRTVFAPLPGFTVWARTYPGYSADFFDGKHFVLLGGSWATARALTRRSFRNWFQPHYPYVFSTFRCVHRG